MEEKKDVFKWYMLFLLIAVIFTIVFTGLNYAGVFGKTVVERKVFENSYQRSAGLKQQIATYEAQIAEIEVQLADPTRDEESKKAINAQLASLRIQLKAARSRQ